MLNWRRLSQDASPGLCNQVRLEKLALEDNQDVSIHRPRSSYFCKSSKCQNCRPWIPLRHHLLLGFLSDHGRSQAGILGGTAYRRRDWIRSTFASLARETFLRFLCTLSVLKTMSSQKPPTAISYPAIPHVLTYSSHLSPLSSAH